MNTLTAVRTFAKPGYCPVKRTRIFADRWYKVTFQNVEHGQGDYIGLGEGEYVQLLPGNKAREARDAHLNHCNAIQEYTGDVWEVYTTHYGHMRQHPVYVSCRESADLTVELARLEHSKWLQDVATSREKYAAGLLAKPNETWRNGSIADCDRILAIGMTTFDSTIKQIKVGA